MFPQLSAEISCSLHAATRAGRLSSRASFIHSCFLASGKGRLFVSLAERACALDLALHKPPVSPPQSTGGQAPRCRRRHRATAWARSCFSSASSSCAAAAARHVLLEAPVASCTASCTSRERDLDRAVHARLFPPRSPSLSPPLSARATSRQSQPPVQLLPPPMCARPLHRNPSRNRSSWLHSRSFKACLDGCHPIGRILCS